MDILQALAGLPGIGPFLPYVTLALAAAGAFAHFVAPYIAPPASPYGLRALGYGLLSMLAGNYRQATNAGASTNSINIPSRVIAAVLATGLAFGVSACSTSPTVAQMQAIVAGIDGAVTVERANILAAVPDDKRDEVTLALDGLHAAAQGVAAINPTASSRDQVVAGLQAFITAAAPMAGQLPIPAKYQAMISAGLPVLSAFIGMLPPASVVRS